MPDLMHGIYKLPAGCFGEFRLPHNQMRGEVAVPLTVDPTAVFLFVAPAEVTAVAERFGGAPFDIENVFWSHRGDACTFDAMVDEFGLDLEPLRRLAMIVRGADTGRPDLVPEAAGLLAASLGLSRMYADDLEQLEAGVSLYDAFYRWCRDATDETHNWPTNKAGAGR